MSSKKEVPFPRTPIIAAVAATVFILVISLVSFFSLRSVIASKDNAAFRITTHLIKVEKLTIATEKKVASSRGYLITLETRMRQRMDEAREEFLLLLRELQESTLSEQGKKYLVEIAGIEEKHQKALEQIITRREEGMLPGELDKIFTAQLWPIRNQLDQSLRSFEQFQEERLKEARTHSIQAARTAMYLTLFMGLISLLVIPLLAGLLIRSILTQKRLLSEAQLSSERFLDLVNHLDHSIVWEAVYEPFAYRFVSERSQFLLGVSGKDWIDNPEAFYHLIPEEDQETVRTTFARAAQTMTDTRCTHRMRTVEGKIIWVQTGAHPRRQEDKVVLYGLTMDVTPLKVARENLMKSERQFSAIMDNAPSVIYLKDPEGRYVFGNRNVPKIFKRDLDQILGKTDFDLFPLAVAKHIRENDLQVLKTGKSMESEEKVPEEGEEKTFFSIKFALKDENEKIYGLCGISTNIHERKKAEEALQSSEERLALAVEAAGMGVWDWDLRSDRIIWNDNTERILDYPVGVHEHKFTEFEARIHSEDKALTLAALQSSINQRKDFRQEFRIVRSDGSVHIILGLGRAIYDDKNSPCRMVGVILDVTERKHFEKSLQDAIRTREELLAIVSHDLRNPLGAMLMTASLIERKTPEDVSGVWVREQSRKIKRAGQRMNALIEDLLSLAKIEAGHFSLDKEKIAAKKAVDEALESFQPLAHEKHIRLEKHLPLTDVEIMADPNQLSRIFGNLLSNAVKFTPENGLVEVSMKVHPKHVSFSVKDTGPGIAEHHLDQVFDRFWQAQGTAHKGTGLGLAISKGLVQAHGGTISAHSRFGEGATFSFTIPRAI